MSVLLTYRNRVITETDLGFIVTMIDQHRSKGRSAISRRLCEAWNWRQANGHLKDGVCRGLLLQLERQQLVTLPPRIMDINNNSRRRTTTAAPAKLDFQPVPITCSLAELAPITLHQVRRTPEEKTFNALIRQYHYLGYAQPVGEHLKYLAYAGERLVACFAFASAPYAIDCRDSFIGWSKQYSLSSRIEILRLFIISALSRFFCGMARINPTMALKYTKTLVGFTNK
jgi:hypothetical protein